MLGILVAGFALAMRVSECIIAMSSSVSVKVGYCLQNTKMISNGMFHHQEKVFLRSIINTAHDYESGAYLYQRMKTIILLIRYYSRKYCSVLVESA